MRIAIMGYSGSGKSTLAKTLGQRYALPVVHLDQLHFRKNWVERSDEVAMFLLKPWLNEPNWVIDGNYHHLGYEFSRITCLRRALFRYRQYRGKTRPDMTPGCPEKFDFAFFRWILHDGRKKTVRRRYQQLMETYPEKCILCRTPRALRHVLERGLI